MRADYRHASLSPARHSFINAHLKFIASTKFSQKHRIQAARMQEEDSASLAAFFIYCAAHELQSQLTVKGNRSNNHFGGEINSPAIGRRSLQLPN